MTSGFVSIRVAQSVWHRDDLLNLLEGMESVPVPAGCEYTQGFHDAITTIARFLGYQRKTAAPAIWIVPDGLQIKAAVTAEPATPRRLTGGAP